MLFCMHGIGAPACMALCSPTCSRTCPALASPTAACTSCTPCPVGTFASGAGTITCTACPAGMVALTPGATTCSPCPAGKRYVNAMTCEPCPAGTSGQDGMTCRPCLKGMYQSSTGERLGRLRGRTGAEACRWTSLVKQAALAPDPERVSLPPPLRRLRQLLGEP